MIRVNFHGSKWAGEPPDPPERLFEVLATEPLDPSFEVYGNFALNLGEETGERGVIRFWGNFYALSHVFSIDSDEQPFIDRMIAAIKANQASDAYQAAKAEQIGAKRQAEERKRGRLRLSARKARVTR